MMDQEEQDIENLPDGQELPEASPATRTPSAENSNLDKNYSQVGSDPIGSISILLKHAPFFDYISHIASRRYPGELEDQLETLEIEHRRIYSSHRSRLHTTISSYNRGSCHNCDRCLQTTHALIKIGRGPTI